MGVTPVSSVKTVTTAGTRVQVSTDTDIKPASIYFEAARANTGIIYVGLSDVSSTVYISSLAAGQGFSLDSSSSGIARVGGVDLQLSSLYVDSSVNGEKVSVTYMYRMGG